MLDTTAAGVGRWRGQTGGGGRRTNRYYGRGHRGGGRRVGVVVDGRRGFGRRGVAFRRHRVGVGHDHVGVVVMMPLPAAVVRPVLVTVAAVVAALTVEAAAVLMTAGLVVGPVLWGVTVRVLVLDGGDVVQFHVLSSHLRPVVYLKSKAIYYSYKSDKREKRKKSIYLKEREK